MNTLVFQISIKQWDKGQRSEADIAKRAALPDRHSIATQPAYFVLDRPCIIDQHGDDIPTNVFPQGRVKKSLLPDGSITIDRFHISQTEGGLSLSYQGEKQDAVTIGLLDSGWIQARYSWRYKVKEGGMNYWLYEEFTLNAACIDDADPDYFLLSAPQKVFEDEQSAI